MSGQTTFCISCLTRVSCNTWFVHAAVLSERGTNKYFGELVTLRNEHFHASYVCYWYVNNIQQSLRD